MAYYKYSEYLTFVVILEAHSLEFSVSDMFKEEEGHVIVFHRCVCLGER